MNLTLSQLFICPQTNQHPRRRPKTLYTILGPYPYSLVYQMLKGKVFFPLKFKMKCHFLKFQDRGV